MPAAEKRKMKPWVWEKPAPRFAELASLRSGWARMEALRASKVAAGR